MLSSFSQDPAVSLEFKCGDSKLLISGPPASVVDVKKKVWDLNQRFSEDKKDILAPGITRKITAFC